MLIHVTYVTCFKRTCFKQNPPIESVALSWAPPGIGKANLFGLPQDFSWDMMGLAWIRLGTAQDFEKHILR